jgi:pimeloyl-ACP methyl ester carboxylesterase
MPVARVNGINLDYFVIGQGTPLVMIMGMGFGRKGWRFQTDFFRRYFQVITFDNRGAGNSDKPDGPYSIRMMAEDTIGLMDYLHIEKAHILGISLGGMIAQELAINFPQRVDKLVLGSTFCQQDNNTNGEYPEWNQAVESRFKGNYNPMFDKLFNKRMSRMIFGSVLKRALKKAGEAGNLGMAGQYQASLKHHTADRLPQIKSPTLVIGGTADKVIIPGSYKVISNLIPGSKLVMFENGSHSIFVEARGRFNQEVLNFLKQN